MKNKFFVYMNLIFLFSVLSLSSYALTVTTCVDGSVSTNNVNFTNVAYNTWQYWNSTNNTRVGGITSIIAQISGITCVGI